MKERPILFSGPMVRALLDGSKTQTRRVVKNQHHEGHFVLLDQGDGWWPYRSDDGERSHYTNAKGYDVEESIDCPFGRPGDRLWVRETWQHSNHPFGPYREDCDVFYRADYHDDPHGADGELSPEGKYRRWRPSIHMPRKAARLILEITAVRVELLQGISEEDARAEGMDMNAAAVLPWEQSSLLASAQILTPHAVHRLTFSELWDRINGDGSWESNPWVWVIEFKVVKP